MLNDASSERNTEIYESCGNAQWRCPSDNCTTGTFPINPDLVLRDYQVVSLGLQGPVTVLATSVAASGPASTATATLSPTSCPATPTKVACDSAASPSQGTVAAVGAGVGVPLGVAAISFLGLLLWERRRNRRLQKSITNAPMTNTVPPYSTLPPDHEQPFSPITFAEDRSPSELNAEPKPAVELPHGL